MKSGAISRIRQGRDSCAAFGSLILILDPYDRRIVRGGYYILTHSLAPMSQGCRRGDAYDSREVRTQQPVRACHDFLSRIWTALTVLVPRNSAQPPIP